MGYLELQWKPIAKVAPDLIGRLENVEDDLIKKSKKEMEVNSVLRCALFITIGLIIVFATVEEFRITKVGSDFGKDGKLWSFSGENININYTTIDFIFPSMIFNIIGWGLVLLGAMYLYTTVIRLLLR